MSYLQPWHVGGTSWSMSRDSDIDTDAPEYTVACSGWTGFHLGPVPSTLEELGFLTSAGCRRIRDACGEDYTAHDLIADVRARGWAWLPWSVLDSYAPWEVILARRVHVEFCRKFETL